MPDAMVDHAHCVVCGCLLFVEVDGTGSVCIACRHETGERPLGSEDRAPAGQPVEDDDA